LSKYLVFFSTYLVCLSKYLVFSSKYLVFLSKYLVFSSIYLVFLSKYLLFSRKYLLTRGRHQIPTLSKILHLIPRQTHQQIGFASNSILSSIYLLKLNAANTFPKSKNEKAIHNDKRKIQFETNQIYQIWKRLLNSSGSPPWKVLVSAV